MPLTSHYPIGKTGLITPAIGIGTGSFSGLYREVPEAEAIATIHHAIDQGANLIDTAPWYGAFVAERYVGAALASRPRDSYLLATKVCLWNENGQAVRGYTRDSVLRLLDSSFKRLGVDKIDILHIHDPVPEAYQMILDETYPTLAELKAQGVIKAIGCGTGDWQMLDKLGRALPLDLVMLAGRYTLLEQPALSLLNTMLNRGIPVFSAGIYNSGILATGAVNHAKYNYSDAPPEVLDKARRLGEICDKHGVPLKAAAAQFVRAHPAITTIILGVESPEQVTENLSVFDVPLPAALWDDFRAAGLIDAAAPVPQAAS